ncbi:MAG: hypothetical protein KC561_18015, partial [Myxococcales bacterium]|nr:hypothetical protein [Myxococcales bacterium]
MPILLADSRRYGRTITQEVPMYRALLVVLALPFTGCIVEHAPDDEPVVLPPAAGDPEGATPRPAARGDGSDRAAEALE